MLLEIKNSDVDVSLPKIQIELNWTPIPILGLDTSTMDRGLLELSDTELHVDNGSFGLQLILNHALDTPSLTWGNK